MTISIQKLQPSNAEELYRLRHQALVEEPFAFLSSPEDDLARTPAEVKARLAVAPDQAVIFGAFDGENLVGMVGLTRDRPIKALHRACIWGVFVKKSHRRMGIGSKLLAATVDHARQIDGLASVYLSVSEKTPGAKRLYESSGFIVWGVEPDCIRYGGESVREYHLAMSI